MELSQNSILIFLFEKGMNDRVSVKVNCVGNGPQLSGRNFIVITDFIELSRKSLNFEI